MSAALEHAPDPADGPYRLAARHYREAGWVGVLPVVGKSRDLPGGYTGRTGGDPTDAEVAEWAQQRGADNVVLRMPPDVVGIDVDAYGDRQGELTLITAEDELGPLPPTWHSTSRHDDAVSGIRFFRVPGGTKHWPSELGPNVQVIRHGHRYALVWPSVNPDSGGRCGWYRHGELVGAVPRPQDLTQLPDAWVRHLGGARAARSVGHAGNGAGPGQAPAVAGLTERDVRELLVTGVPVGQQNERLFGYACSLRGRRLHRDEAVLLVVQAIQRMPNDPGSHRGDWNPIPDGVAMVDRVWSEYPPGEVNGALTNAQRQFLERVTATDEPAGDAEDEPDPFVSDCTQTGNVHRFTRRFAGKLMYVPGAAWPWHIWDGTYWRPDELNDVLHLTEQVLAELRLAMLEQPEDRRAAWSRHYQVSSSVASREGVLRGAAADPKLKVAVRELDTDPYSLVVRNGTLDLRTGTLRASRPADRNTLCAATAHDPAADCPRWRAHVALAASRTDGSRDEEMEDYLARWAGYSLTGLVQEQKFAFCYGGGDNGKNAFIQTLLDMMGSYATKASDRIIFSTGNEHTTIITDLANVRMAYIDEAPAGRVDESRLKELTGSKSIRARRVNKDSFVFKLKVKLWISGNNRPHVADTSRGFWRRLDLIPFDATIPPGQVIRDYDAVLAAERPGILNWALAGLRDYQERGGLHAPARVLDATAEYREEENPFRLMLEERFDAERLDWTPNHVIHAVYSSWCAESGVKPLSIQRLTPELRRCGFVRDPVPHRIREPFGSRMARGWVGPVPEQVPSGLAWQRTT